MSVKHSVHTHTVQSPECLISMNTWKHLCGCARPSTPTVARLKMSFPSFTKLLSRRMSTSIQLNIPMHASKYSWSDYSSAHPTRSNIKSQAFNSLRAREINPHSRTHIKLTVFFFFFFNSMRRPDARYAGKLRLKEERKRVLAGDETLPPPQASI